MTSIFDMGGPQHPSDGRLGWGDPVVKQCAQCGAPIKLVPSDPRDTSDGTLWSDGYLEAPYLPEPSLLGKCRSCGAIGCLAELSEIEDASQLPPEADHSLVPLSRDDYAVLLDNLQAISEPFHVYLRSQFWHLSNHRRRAGDDSQVLSEAERTNLTELYKLLGDQDPPRLMKVEILRELGEFEQAEALLAEPFHERFKPFVDRLRQLLRARNPRLVKMGYGASLQEPHV